jgi:redoxin
VRLRDYAGKTIVLEWTNDGCPFVGKHYDSGNMQALQQKYTAAGIVWLTVASSAPGEEGYVTPAEAKADLARWRAAPTDFLLDPDGTLGHLYDARATPHMVVIDRSGRLVYMGAIDDKPSTRLADVKTAHNYVVAALDALAAGQPVAVASTRAYGCSVKYKDE